MDNRTATETFNEEYANVLPINVRAIANFTPLIGSTYATDVSRVAEWSGDLRAARYWQVVANAILENARG